MADTHVRRSGDAPQIKPGPSRTIRTLAAVAVIAMMAVVVHQKGWLTSGGSAGVLSAGQIEACKFDYGTEFFNMYGGSFADYDFGKARLLSANKVNGSADDFTNYLFQIPSRTEKRPITCGIYQRRGKWLSVTRHPW